jgi:hypothetical protein
MTSRRMAGGESAWEANLPGKGASAMTQGASQPVFVSRMNAATLAAVQTMRTVTGNDVVGHRGTRGELVLSSTIPLWSR